MSAVCHQLTNKKYLQSNFDPCCCQMVGKVCWYISRETELIALPSSPIGCHSSVTGVPTLPLVLKSTINPNEILKLN